MKLTTVLASVNNNRDYYLFIPKQILFWEKFSIKFIAIFIGDSTCTTSGATIGRTIANGTSQTFNVSAGDMIYGISAAASAAGAVVITYSA